MSKIPEGHQTVIPYLILDGAAKFPDFVKNVLGAEEKHLHRRPEDDSKIMHGEVKIGTATIMFADSTDQYSAQTAGLYIYVDGVDEVYRKALAAGARSVMEVSDQSYGRSGGVLDPTGVTWWLTEVI
ncbi:VOC family protein [Chitinophaga sedimenti]|uniref:VOC family protein n=1 Tax=Chitinophaga sedimenti TaxID=2033606 RepID=UPI002003CD5F|nr:VOC family protein [Chitinophaga sedimenti]MCK7555109.1 VOC family protein [Chitinophaga sedimenti]